MRKLWTGAIRAILLIPFGTVFASGTCSVEVLRDAADGLNNVANDLDGNQDVDLGDLLSDELDHL